MDHVAAEIAATIKNSPATNSRGCYEISRYTSVAEPLGLSLRPSHELGRGVAVGVGNREKFKLAPMVCGGKGLLVGTTTLFFWEQAGRKFDAPLVSVTQREPADGCAATGTANNTKQILTIDLCNSIIDQPGCRGAVPFQHDIGSSIDPDRGSLPINCANTR